jgi:hypothetical protein
MDYYSMLEASNVIMNKKVVDYELREKENRESGDYHDRGA